MKLLENWTMFKSFGLGFGVVLLAPTIAKIAGEVAKPIVKTMIKGGIIVYDQGKSIVEGTMERLDDITTEAKTEVHGRREKGARSES